METKQLNNYKIEFYSEKEWNKEYVTSSVYPSLTDTLGDIFDLDKNKYIYIGKVSDISEELAKKLVEGNNGYNDSTMWLNYKTNENNFVRYHCNTAKQSFQTLSDLKYCVILKL